MGGLAHLSPLWLVPTLTISLIELFPVVPPVKLKLVCQNALATPREITIDQFPIVLGRGAGVGVRIDDRWLSRRHCELHIIEGRVHVRDLGSLHGTFVRGQAITESPLNPGDELQIGLSHFLVQYQASEPPIHDSAAFDSVLA